MLSMPGIDKCTAQIASRSAGVAGVALSRTLQEGALLALAAVCYQAREHPTEVRMRPWQCDATLTPRLTGWYRGQQSRAMSPSIANLGVAGAFVCVAAIHEDVDSMLGDRLKNMLWALEDARYPEQMSLPGKVCRLCRPAQGRLHRLCQAKHCP